MVRREITRRLIKEAAEAHKRQVKAEKLKESLRTGGRIASGEEDKKPQVKDMSFEMLLNAIEAKLNYNVSVGRCRLVSIKRDMEVHLL